MKIFKNVLQPKTLNTVRSYLQKNIGSYKWSSSEMLWNPGLRLGTTGSVLVQETTQELRDLMIPELNKVLPEYEDININYHLWLRGSGISAHTDSDYKFGATLYLNEEWHVNFGGMFVWQPKGEDTMRAIIPEENTATGIIDKVSCVASILDMTEFEKDLVLTELKNEVNDLQNIVTENENNPKKVMFILGMESGSPTVGGIGTSADGFIKMTGGINVMSSFEGWKPVSTESIIEASPDFIIISNRGLSSFKTVEKLGQHPTLVFTPASKENNIIAMDGMAMLGFGPRTISSAKEVALRYISENE